MVALDSHGEVIGCATLGLSTDADGALAGWLGRLVVAPQWRNQGIGTILVGMVPKFIVSTSGVNVASAPSFTIFGSCSTAGRSFYNRAGYKVFDAGTPLRLPFGNRATLHNNNAAYPCWFTKTII
jgi:GNAT superfamily N-acetyltransferase